jgi:hypothetical protein
MEELVYTKSSIVTLVTFEGGKRQLIVADDIYAAMETAMKYHGLVMAVEVLGFAEDLFFLP